MVDDRFDSNSNRFKGFELFSGRARGSSRNLVAAFELALGIVILMWSWERHRDGMGGKTLCCSAEKRKSGIHGYKFISPRLLVRALSSFHLPIRSRLSKLKRSLLFCIYFSLSIESFVYSRLISYFAATYSVQGPWKYCEQSYLCKLPQVLCTWPFRTSSALKKERKALIFFFFFSLKWPVRILMGAKMRIIEISVKSERSGDCFQLKIFCCLLKNILCFPGLRWLKTCIFFLLK